MVLDNRTRSKGKLFLVNLDKLRSTTQYIVKVWLHDKFTINL